MIYLGTVETDDDLYGYLKYDIQPQIADFCEEPCYHVWRLNGSNDVFLYEERQTGARLVGKFFEDVRRLEREYGNLVKVRGYGFDEDPFYVAEPLGKNENLSNFLAVEYCTGELLGDIITRAIADKDETLLYGKLSALAHFFAELHNRTAIDVPADFNEACDYMNRVIEQDESLLTDGEADVLYALRDEWRDKSEMGEDCQVLIHGDATPANFIFGDFDAVKTFDLERCQYADRASDIGRMAGELKHFFMSAKEDGLAAEPFIDHFLREYASRFPDAEAAFNAVTKRVPFYMGTTLLRIGRNFWIDRDYRRRLIDEAEKCLQGGLQA